MKARIINPQGRKVKIARRNRMAAEGDVLNGDMARDAVRAGDAEFVSYSTKATKAADMKILSKKALEGAPENK
jgi:hypothetical protein